MAIQAGIKVVVDQGSIQQATQQIDDVSKKMQDVLDNIKANINVEDSMKQLQGLQTEIDTLKESLANMSKTDNESLINSTPTVTAAKDIEGSIDQIKEKLATLDGVSDVKIKVSADGIETDTKAIQTFTAEVKTAAGELTKLEFMSNGSQTKDGSDSFDFSNVKGITDNTSAIEQKKATQEENAALTDTQTLLTKQYQLETDLNTAKQKGKQDTIDELTAQKELNETKIGDVSSGLSNDSLAKVTQQASVFQDKLNTQTAQQSDKEKQVTIQLQEQLDIYTKQVEIKMKNLNNSMIGVKFDTAPITTQIEKIQSELNGLNLNNFNSNATAKINTDLKEVTSGLGTLKAEAASAGGVFSDLLTQSTKFASWMASATLFMGAINGIKDMISSVVTLDSQLTQLSYVSNMSTQQLKDFASSEIGVATSMGSTVDTVREASRIFTNLNSTTAQVLENTKAATAFSNVTGQDIETSASALQSVTNQFTEMQGKTMQAGDAITKVAANLSMDFQTASTNIASAVKISGSAMSEAGMSFNTYLGYISAAEEKTQLSGETLGTAFKTMAARINQVKTDDLTPTTDEMSNAEKSLNEIGISIRAADGTLNPLSTTLQSLGEKWGSLNNVQKSNIGYYVAGTRQISILDATMGSYTKATELSTIAQKSAGNLMAENAKYADSFAGRMNSLTATWQGFSTQLINNAWLKNIVTGLNDLSYGVKDLISCTPLLTVAALALFAAFEKVALEKNLLGLGTLSTIFSNLATQVSFTAGTFGVLSEDLGLAEATSITASAGFGALKVALVGVATTAGEAMLAMATNPLTWIVAGIAEVMALTSAWQKQQDEIKALKQEYIAYEDAIKGTDSTKVTSSISDIKAAQDKLDTLKDKMNNASTSGGRSQTRIDYTAEIEALSKAGYTVDETTGKIKNLKTAQDALGKDNSMSAAQRELEANSTALTSATGAAIDSYYKLSTQENKGTVEKKQQSDAVKILTDTYTDLTTKTDKNGVVTITNTGALAKDTEALITNKGALSSNATTATTASTQIKSLADAETDLGDALSKAKSNIESINTVLANHASTGTWDYDTILTLTKAYPNLLTAMGSDKTLTEALTQAKQNETNAATGSIDDQMTAIDNQVDSALKAYGIDLKNFASAEEAKTAIAKAESQKRIDTELAEADAKDAKGDTSGADKESQLAENAQKKLDAGQVSASSDDNALIDQYFNEKTEKAGADKLLANVQSQAEAKAQKTADDAAKTAADKQAAAVKKAATDALDSQAKSLQAAAKAYDSSVDGQLKTLSDQKKEYDQNVDNASKAEIQSEDAIIKGYQTQLDALKAKNQLQLDNNTLIKDQTDLIKAQQDMQNAQSEKDVRVYENGQWQWEADKAAVNTAKDTLATANTTLTTEIASLAEKAAEDAISGKITTETDNKSTYATNYQNNKDATDQANQAKQDALNNQKTSTDANYSAQEDVVSNKKDALNGYANGTDNVPETGSYLVGEQGREIVTLPQGASVTPNNVTEKALSGSANIATQAASTSATNVIITDTKKALSDIDDTLNTFTDASGQYSKDMEKTMGDSVTTNKLLAKKPIIDLKTEIDTELKQYVNGTGAYSVTANKNIGDAITTSAPTVTDPTKLLVGNVKNLIVTFAQSTIDDGHEVTSQLGKGITDGEADLTKVIDDLCTKITTQFRKDMQIHSPSAVMHEIGGFITQGLINGMDEADIEKFISDKVGSMNGAFSGGASNISGSLKDWVAQALKDTGLDASNAPMLETIAMKESSGDPTNINTYDINAQEGHPSKGLMQMIDETFNDHKLPGHDNIMNPVDNLDSAIKYMLSRYGSISNVPGIKSMAAGGAYQGYATGSESIPNTGLAMTGENGAEMRVLNQGDGVITAERTKALNLLADSALGRNSNMLASLPSFSQPNINVNIPKADKTPVQQGSHITVQNVNMPDGIDVEGFINTLNQIAKTS